MWWMIRIRNARRIWMSEKTSWGSKRWCDWASQEDIAAANAITCWRLLGWSFSEYWTLSPYWAAAFWSLVFVYFCSPKICKILLAVCWVLTSKFSIHFLISPWEALLGWSWWSLKTGLEGFSTSSAHKVALGGGAGGSVRFTPWI